MLLRVLLFIVLLIGVGATLVFIQRDDNQEDSKQNNVVSEAGIPLIVKQKSIIVEVVDTPQERTKGLSQRTELGEDQGMLFVFQEPGHVGIWMKDMIFSIDILWLDEEKNVADIKKNATPESYPEVFYPSALVLYVLEVNAGFIETHGIEIGDQAEW